MKKVLKIAGVIIGSILGLVILIVIGTLIISKFLGYKKEVENPIYQPNHEWTYDAYFYNESGNLLDSQVVKLKIFDERFFISQTKIKWIFEKNNATSGVTETTGVIENDKRVWIHPPRSNNFTSFTEYSGFPEVRFPVEVGKTWKSALTLGTYATEKSGNKLNVDYEIISDSEHILTNNGVFDCIKIKAVGSSGLGEYSHTYYFDSTYGFVYSEYEKSAGEKLILSLKDIKGFKKRSKKSVAKLQVKNSLKTK